MEKNRIKRAFLLRIGKNHDAEIFFWHEHHARYETRDASGVTDQFASMIIAQSPAEAVIGKFAA